MVVGPFRPAMRSASVVDNSLASSLEAASETASPEAALEAVVPDAAPPQAARLRARASASSTDVSFFMRGSLFSSSDSAIPVPQKLCTESSDCLFIFFTKQICKIICFAGLSLL